MSPPILQENRRGHRVASAQVGGLVCGSRCTHWGGNRLQLSVNSGKLSHAWGWEKVTSAFKAGNSSEPRMGRGGAQNNNVLDNDCC